MTENGKDIKKDRVVLAGLNAHGLPEEEGQTNFAPAGTPYAVTGDGVAVLLDGEWVLFSPVPPWESQD